MNKKQLIKIYIEIILLFCVIPAFYFWLARVIAVVPGQLIEIVILMVGSWFMGAKTYSACLKYKNLTELENENINRDS